MKIAVCSITHHSVHTPMQVGRHILDWQLQTDDRYFLNIVHDGLAPEDWDCEIDEHLGGNLDHNVYRISYCKERRKCWGAWNRKDWLNNLDTEEFDWIYMCCVDDQINPKFVANMVKSIENNPKAFFHSTELSHHHYGQHMIPLGTYPTLNRCDFSSFLIDSKLAKKVGINHPEEYAADGLFIQECFAEIGFDESRVVLNSNILVFKN